MNGTLWSFCFLLLVLVFNEAKAFPEDTAEDKRETIDSYINKKGFLDSYIDAQVRALKERYSLTTEQTGKVRESIRKEDIRFLLKASGQVEEFDRNMRKLMEQKEEPTVQDLQDVQKASERLYPLCQKTLQQIMLRTMRVHSILTDEQKKLHEKEIDELELNTAELTGRLGRWVEGDIKLEELKQCFGAKPQDDEQALTDTDLRMYRATSLDYWDLYVKTFIEAFQLDQGQRVMAYSVFAEAKVRANCYRKDHEAQYAEVKKRMESLRRYRMSDKVNGRNVMELVGELRKRTEEIDKPLLEIFDDLRRRLMRIPTEDQRKEALDLFVAGQTATQGAK